MTTDHHRLLAEDLLLLAFDDEAGRPRTATSGHLPLAIGGALLAELALRDRLRLEVDQPRASSRPTGDALLDEVAAQVREGSRRRTVKGWVRRVGRAGRRDQVRDRLVARGLLVPTTREVLGPVSMTRHHLADPATVERLASEVRGVLVDGRPTTPRTRALAALVGATAVLNVLVERNDRREARRQAERLADSPTLPAAARAVLHATRSAAATSTGTAGSTAGS